VTPAHGPHQSRLLPGLITIQPGISQHPLGITEPVLRDRVTLAPLKNIAIYFNRALHQFSRHTHAAALKTNTINHYHKAPNVV